MPAAPRPNTKATRIAETILGQRKKRKPRRPSTAGVLNADIKMPIPKTFDGALG